MVDVNGVTCYSWGNWSYYVIISKSFNMGSGSITFLWAFGVAFQRFLFLVSLERFKEVENIIVREIGGNMLWKHS